MKHRSATTIIAQILGLASQRISKSRIMYGAFLSHQQVQLYLQILMERGLIAKEKTSNAYKTTNKGMQFLKLYRQMEEFLPNLVWRNDNIVASP
jgi:predicted transcriptional regulator